MTIPQTKCKQCGTCCTNGGPALHIQDIPLVSSGDIPLEDLITIRKNEFVYNPLAARAVPANCEIIKIKGTGKTWNCFYFDTKNKNCTIYNKRPHACIALKCWEPDASIDLIEKDVVNRLDILVNKDKLSGLVRNYEEICQCPDLVSLLKEISENNNMIPEWLTKLVNKDIAYRNKVIKQDNISMDMELFLFGRPIFQVIKPMGISTRELNGRLELFLGK